MNVLRFELRAARTTTFFWIMAIVALTSMYLSIYPAFSNDADELIRTLQHIPTAMNHILGMGGDLRLFSFFGFFGNVFPFVTLIGAIQAAVVGLGILSKEPAAGTTDFLLSKPKTRTAVYCEKVAASLGLLIVTEIVVTVSAYVLAKAFGSGDIDGTQYLLFWGAFALIQWWFFSLGLLLSQLVRKFKSVTPLAVGLSFGFFLLAIFGMIVGDDAVRWMTPFRFIDYKKIVTDSAYDPAHIVYGVGLIAIFVVVSYLIYTRKDIPATL
jgi:ABC-2 type transport system permease protein